MRDFHPLVKRLMDGEVALADLPPELRAEGEAALRLLAAVPRAPVALPEALNARVMAEVRRAPPVRWGHGWRWLTEPREVRIHVRPWTIPPLLAAAAALVFLLVPAPEARPMPERVTVRFVLVAPDARQVAVAGTFNAWDAAATPLARTTAAGVWSVTVTIPPGEHQYGFVVDGGRWVPDPAAPAVSDGFGRQNSVLAL